MKKITVIGNSHVAALKSALDHGKAAVQEAVVVFFALPDSTHLKASIGSDNRFGVKAIRNSLEPVEKARALRINGGALDIGLSDTGVIVLVGIDWELAALAEIITNYSVPGINDGDHSHKMTCSAFDAMCRSLAKASLPNAGFLNTGARVLSVLAPVPSEQCLRADVDLPRDLTLVRLAQKRNANLKPALNALISRIKTAHLENGCAAIEPPASVRGKSGLTRHVFSQDSLGLLKNAHDSQDFRHMNDTYGQVVWKMILEHLDG